MLSANFRHSDREARIGTYRVSGHVGACARSTSKAPTEPPARRAINFQYRSSRNWRHGLAFSAHIPDRKQDLWPSRRTPIAATEMLVALRSSRSQWSRISRPHPPIQSTFGDARLTTFAHPGRARTARVSPDTPKRSGDRGSARDSITIRSPSARPVSQPKRVLSTVSAAPEKLRKFLLKNGLDRGSDVLPHPRADHSGVIASSESAEVSVVFFMA